jgi:hypothetical protein
MELLYRCRLVRQSEIVILSSVFEACSVVEPAGAGLVASAPDMPAQVMGSAVPGAGEQVDQAFYFGDGEWNQSGVRHPWSLNVKRRGRGGWWRCAQAVAWS